MKKCPRPRPPLIATCFLAPRFFADDERRNNCAAKRFASSFQAWTASSSAPLRSLAVISRPSDTVGDAVGARDAARRTLSIAGRHASHEPREVEEDESPRAEPRTTKHRARRTRLRRRELKRTTGSPRPGLLGSHSPPSARLGLLASTPSQSSSASPLASQPETPSRSLRVSPSRHHL